MRGDGKVAVVTGAASGIGLTTTKLMAKLGWKVYAVDINEKSSYADFSHQVHWVVADLTQKADCDRLVDQVFNDPICKKNGLSALINCAGVILPCPVLGADWKQLESQFHINALSPMYLTHQLVALLLQSKSGGNVVNVSSLAALIAWPYQGVYTSSKSALEGFSASLHREIISSRLPLRVSCVQPGPVKSPFAVGDTEKLRGWVQSHPENPFSHGASKSAALKEGLENYISFNNPFISVPCSDVAESVYCNIVSKSHPPRFCFIMTTGFHILRVLMHLLPSQIADYIAANYL